MKLILALLLATCFASAVFVAFPSIDLVTARLFYNGAAFRIEDNRAVEAIRITLFAAEDIGFLLILALCLRRRPFLNLSARAWLFLTLIFVLGSGLLVNGLLKPMWNRARPFQIVEFGGAAQFTPAWVINHNCCGYTSFVSGEMAGATVLAICLTLILRANRACFSTFRYRTGLFLTPVIPLFTAWQRMASGRHFLSDIVIAMLLMGLLAAALHRILGAPTERQALLTSQPIPPISRLP